MASQTPIRGIACNRWFVFCLSFVVKESEVSTTFHSKYALYWCMLYLLMSLWCHPRSMAKTPSAPVRGVSQQVLALRYNHHHDARRKSGVPSFVLFFLDDYPLSFPEVQLILIWIDFWEVSMGTGVCWFEIMRSSWVSQIHGIFISDPPYIFPSWSQCTQLEAAIRSSSKELRSES